MHRSFLLAGGLSLLAFSAAGQITKGTRLLGGSMRYSRTTETRSTTNPAVPSSLREQEYIYRSLDLNPQAGVFIADNLAAGVSLGYSTNKQTGSYYSGPAPDLYERTFTGKSFRVAPYLRYYYMPTATFGVFGQATAYYQRNKSAGSTTAPGEVLSKGSGSGFGVSVTPTLVFFPVEKVGLELAFGYIGYGRNSDKLLTPATNQYEDKITSSEFGTNFGVNQLTLGASYYWGR